MERDATASSSADASQNSPFVKLDKDGSGILMYNSRNIGVTISKTTENTTYTFTADSKRYKVLAYFGCKGQGYVNYANGAPWLTINADGWKICDKAGNITERGKHPRTETVPIECKVTDCITVRFFNSKNIVVKFETEDLDKSFLCGEQHRRADSHLDRVVARSGYPFPGKLTLDVGAIRERFERDGGFTYIKAGPHKELGATIPTGTGNLSLRLGALDATGASKILPAVRSLDATDARVSGIELLPPLQHRHKTYPAPEGYGEPELTASQRRTIKGWRAAERQHYHTKQTKPIYLSWSEFQDKVVGPASPHDKLACVFILATWAPQARQVERAIAKAHWEFLQDKAENETNPGGQMLFYRLEASDCPPLFKKYEFRTVPMFLFFYKQRLVAGSNACRTKEDFKAAALAALEKGRTGAFLPDNHSFLCRDNDLLSGFTPEMSLLFGPGGRREE